MIENNEKISQRMKRIPLGRLIPATDSAILRSFFFGAILFSISVFSACDRENSEDVTGVVELFMLESFETVDASCRIDNSTAKLEHQPLIRYADFLSYDPEGHIFTLSEDAAETVENMEHSVHGVAFGVTADDELVYTGYFWPGYSSATCNWITIDPLSLYQGNELRVQLGYPGMMEGWEIPDTRNDPRIIAIFRRDEKLIE